MSAVQLYYIGDVAVLSVAFTETATGATVDPEAITLSVEKPDGTKQDYPYSEGSGIITRDAEGKYHAEYPIAVIGQHRYRWLCTNPKGVELGSFKSHKTPFDAS